MEQERKVQWELMLKHELDEAVSDYPAVYISFGLCEPHGLYNPLGLDALKAHGLCLRLANRAGGVVAPPFFWHIHEDNVVSQNFLKGITAKPLYLTSIPHDIFFKLYLYQLRACVNAGFKVIVAITGHYGGLEYWLKWYAKLFQKHISPVPIWALADWEVIDYKDEHEDYHGSHAGVCETTQLMALYPDLTSLAHPSLQEADPFAGGRLSTVVSRATVELGECIVNSQIENLTAGVKQMLAVAPKEALPFIVIPEIDAQWDRFCQEAPKFLSEMSEPEIRETYEKGIQPLWKRTRQARGKLPKYVFPQIDMETEL